MKSAILAGLLLASLASPTVWAGAYDDILTAARNDDGAKVIALLERGMDVNTADPHGTTLAMYAARSGDEKLLEYLLDNHSNILIKNEYGDTAIALAALEGHLASVKRLTEAGAEINPGEGSWTPLNYAAFAGKPDVVVYLIERGAAVNARAPNGMTSLMLASRNGHSAVVRLLLAHRAAVGLKAPDGRTALDIARDANQAEVATLLTQSAGS